MNKRAEFGYWVMQCPVITTDHLTVDAAGDLAETLPGEEFHGLYCATAPFGGFVHCSDPSVLAGVPQCVRDVFEWAIREGFEWVRFDPEGDQISDLTVYPR